MTCPYFKSHRIKHGIKEGNIEFKKGKFNIDENDNILVKYTNGDDYTFRLYWYVFYIYIEWDLNMMPKEIKILLNYYHIKWLINMGRKIKLN